jgi:hypothetical protein
VGLASALFANPKHASAMPARPIPNFFSAARRVTDWAMFFVSSSNLLFIAFLFVVCLVGCLLLQYGYRAIHGWRKADLTRIVC